MTPLDRRGGQGRLAMTAGNYSADDSSLRATRSNPCADAGFVLDRRGGKSRLAMTAGNYSADDSSLRATRGNPCADAGFVLDRRGGKSRLAMTAGNYSADDSSLRATRSNPCADAGFVLDRRGGKSRLAMTARSKSLASSRARRGMKCRRADTGPYRSIVPLALRLGGMILAPADLFLPSSRGAERARIRMRIREHEAKLAKASLLAIQGSVTLDCFAEFTPASEPGLAMTGSNRLDSV
jgi:hypothetical protein